MIILGVNGWKRGSHDASAALMQDGGVLCFCEEERFRRKKRALDCLPHYSIAACLKQTGLTVQDIDLIAVGWNYRKRYEDRGHDWELSDDDFVNAMLSPYYFGARGKKIPVFWVEHHLAHAASAFYPSGQKESAIIVLDGQGESISGFVAIGKNNQIFPQWDFPVTESLGYFYESICDYIGLDPQDAGKLMGLAAYGKMGNLFDIFQENHQGYGIRLFSQPFVTKFDIDERKAITEAWIQYLSKQFHLERNIRISAYNKTKNKFERSPVRDPYEYRNLATIGQAHIEHAICSLVQKVVKKTKIRHVSLAGGVALNATANGKLYIGKLIDGLWVQPAANDAGVSLGAAMYAAAQHGFEIEPLQTASLGIEFSNEEIGKQLLEAGIRFQQTDDPAETAAELIASRQTVAWFQGRAEVGPRALGNRSLLALPSDTTMRERINSIIKKREWWRPLAASFLEEDALTYISTKKPLSYMIVTAEVSSLFKKEFRSAMHKDGTTRPQTVNPSNNKIYYDLLTKLKKNTGHGVVLNTSLNGQDEPIVSSPLDVIKLFATSPIDAMVIGNFVVKKQ